MATNYFPRKSETAPMFYAYEDKHDPQLKGMLARALWHAGSARTKMVTD